MHVLKQNLTSRLYGIKVKKKHLCILQNIFQNCMHSKKEKFVQWSRAEGKILPYDAISR